MFDRGYIKVVRGICVESTRNKYVTRRVIYINFITTSDDNILGYICDDFN